MPASPRLGYLILPPGDIDLARSPSLFTDPVTSLQMPSSGEAVSKLVQCTLVGQSFLLRFGTPNAVYTAIASVVAHACPAGPSHQLTITSYGQYEGNYLVDLIQGRLGEPWARLYGSYVL